jgi:hypothetical protein
MPTIEVDQCKKIARQLSSLHTIQRCIDGDISDGDACLKKTLRLVSLKMLSMANKKREESQKPTPTDDLVEPVKRLSISSDEAPPAAVKTIEPSYNHQAKAERHHILINLVGEVKYNEILIVTEDIKEIRSKSAVWTKFSQSLAIPREVQVKNYEGTYDIEEDRAPASESLPSPIYDLYFRTRLIDAMRVVDSRTTKQLQDMPAPCSCVVQRLDWDAMLADAKAKLEAFRKFEEANILPTDNLSFTCSGGMCKLG